MLKEASSLFRELQSKIINEVSLLKNADDATVNTVAACLLHMRACDLNGAKRRHIILAIIFSHIVGVFLLFIYHRFSLLFVSIFFSIWFIARMYDWSALQFLTIIIVYAFAMFHFTSVARMLKNLIFDIVDLLLIGSLTMYLTEMITKKSRNELEQIISFKRPLDPISWFFQYYYINRFAYKPKYVIECWEKQICDIERTVYHPNDIMALADRYWLAAEESAIITAGEPTCTWRAANEGISGGTGVTAPAPERPPKVEARIDVLGDLRATWASFPAHDNASAVGRFLEKVRGSAPGSGLEFEVEYHLDELRHAAEARELRDWEDRQWPEAARAALASKAGKPLSKRVFPLRLQGVSVWPAPKMVVVPPGRFLMGAAQGEEFASKYNLPQHEVRIDYPFAFGQHEVTFAEWDAALAAGARLEKLDDQGWGRGRLPVINVSWEGAQAYLDWLNGRLGLAGRTDAYRLPSEAEWEYACRAETETPFSFGETISTCQAQFSDGEHGSAGSTVPVGSFPANGYGLYDMHGNVWEWCADAWHGTYEGAPTDGSVWEGGDLSGRVIRGGSWRDSPLHLCSANRDWTRPTDLDDYVGFRLARTLSAPAI